MKTIYELTLEDLVEVKSAWFVNSAHLKTAIEAWLAERGYTVTDAASFSLNPDRSVTIEVDVSAPTSVPVLVTGPAAGAPSSGPVGPPLPFTAAPPLAGFSPTGAETLIRGEFSLAPSQLIALCVSHEFEPYAKYGQAIIANCAEHKLNPLFVLANLVNQGVNPEYNNPWGISADNYPHGPNGSQLGQPNGHVPNGPRKFSDTEWRLAFDRQFAVVAGAKAYRNASTIAEWALIDAPPGAENDVHGTNAAEGADVGGIYDRLVKSLTGVG